MLWGRRDRAAAQAGGATPVRRLVALAREGAAPRAGAASLARPRRPSRRDARAPLPGAGGASRAALLAALAGSTRERPLFFGLTLGPSFAPLARSSGPGGGSLVWCGLVYREP
jgi:hypothetical protein